MVDIVSFALETQGFQIVEALDAEQAWKAFQTNDFDIIVLDVMMPRMSGLTLCQRIRQESDVPVMLLTARGEVDDRVAGLEAGADDYVVKPFHPRELALRAQAIVRRFRERADGARIVVDDLVVDPRSASASLGGERLTLTQSEFRLLQMLASRLDEVVTWDELLHVVWGTDSLIGGREMVKTAVYRLRAKLGDSPTDPRYIHTVRGRGYRMPSSRA